MNGVFVLFEKLVYRTENYVNKKLSKFLLGNPDLAYLHIGKNAGSFVKQHNKIINNNYDLKIAACPHRYTLNHIPIDIPYFFSVRSPLERFVSAFNSRRNCGKPKYNNPWVNDEILAFNAFDTANSLAESLFCDNEKGRLAFNAMLSIGHVSEHQYSWFVNKSTLFGSRPPFAILRQEFLSDDFKMMLKKLNISYPLNDFPIIHKSSGPNTLSSLAKDNLSKWFSVDIEFYKFCEDWINQNQ